MHGACNSLNVRMYAVWGLSLIGVMDSSLRRKLALELRAAAEMHELRAAADAERKYALDERVHTMLVFAEVNNFLNRDSFSKDTSTRSSVSSPEYSAAYTPDGASRYSRFAADRDLTSNRNSDSRVCTHSNNGTGSNYWIIHLVIDELCKQFANISRCSIYRASTVCCYCLA